MRRAHMRIVWIILANAVLVSIVGSLKAQPKATEQTSQTGKAPSSTPKRAEEQFKNIQVLKGIPADQLFPTMQFITASLGVECDFCHVRNAFEKDDKKTKQTARKMMEMMFTINKENFDARREVTCYSCHRGNAKPAAIPVVMSEEEARVAEGEPHGATSESEKKESVKESSMPTAQQLLDKYIQAVGGAPAIDRITTRIMKGTIEFGDQSRPIEIYAKDPEQRISYAHMADGDSITAFNGHQGWMSAPGRPVHEMQGSELDASGIDADLHLPTHLQEMFSEMKVEGAEKVGDRDTYAVLGVRAGKTPLRLYFDQQSGLLLRLVRFGETALGWLPTQIDYDDYRDADGVHVPYRWTLARPGGRFTIQLSELKQNVPVDDAKFVKPAAPPEQPKAGKK